MLRSGDFLIMFTAICLTSAARAETPASRRLAYRTTVRKANAVAKHLLAPGPAAQAQTPRDLTDDLVKPHTAVILHQAMACPGLAPLSPEPTSYPARLKLTNDEAALWFRCLREQSPKLTVFKQHAVPAPTTEQATDSAVVGSCLSDVTPRPDLILTASMPAKLAREGQANVEVTLAFVQNRVVCAAYSRAVWIK